MEKGSETLLSILIFSILHLTLSIILLNEAESFASDEVDIRSENETHIGKVMIFEASDTKSYAISCNYKLEKISGECIPLGQCALFFDKISSMIENPCMDFNTNTVCCPIEDEDEVLARKPPGFDIGILDPPPIPKVEIPEISQTQLRKITEESLKTFKKAEQIEEHILFREKIVVPRGSPASKHQKLLATTTKFLAAGKDAQLGLEVSMNIVKSFKLTKQQGAFALQNFNAKGTKVAHLCQEPKTCKRNEIYRSIDGSCNNLNNPNWGKSGISLQRILPPMYQDGVNSPRTRSKSGEKLPSPRKISSALVRDENRPYGKYTLMVMQWGQFINHDISFTPSLKGPNKTEISCCNSGQRLPADLKHSACFPIFIPEQDPFYSRFGQRCMEFVRSLPAPRPHCNFGPREQMNQITGFIDGSNVYGSNEKLSQNLRMGIGGKLKVQTYNGRDLLPMNPKECTDSQQNRHCFKAGDSRVNEQVELAVLHTVWLREHNRVADELQRLNPHWPDEVLFQEARKIIIAEKQHIIYNEYLPIIIGTNNVLSFSLQPGRRSLKSLYDDSINPSITNAFTTAAFRFGHSLVQGIVKGYNQFGTLSEVYPLEKTQFSPYTLYESYDSFLRGLITQQSQKFDYFVTDTVTKHLFETNSHFGLDLISLNIQRGRDHGIPPYNDWREICGLPKIVNWAQLAILMDPEAVLKLKSVYKSVDDIDLYPGGISERSAEGALLGPVFQCIVTDQFSRLRRGDRFYYEEPTAGFTEVQMNELKKISLARIICDNSDEIKTIQPLVFQSTSSMYFIHFYS